MTARLPSPTPRQSLALLVRILASLGYDDKLAGHVSVRDRDDHSLLVTPLGVFWRELRARDLIRVDPDGKVVEGEGRANPTIIFHAELHRARPDIRVALHNHPPFGSIWAAAGELPPLLDQTGANGGGRAVIYREYEGAVIDRRAAAELARAYGSADLAILAQHGTLVTGSSIPQVLVRALSFEWRCRKAWEVACMGKTGTPLPEATAEALAQYADEYGELLFEAYGREQIARDPGLLT
jgi:ribulose-5-phosphate 4-epimerase/fuculose-1-phosphate aldolase